MCTVFRAHCVKMFDFNSQKPLQPNSQSCHVCFTVRCRDKLRGATGPNAFDGDRFLICKKAVGDMREAHPWCKCSAHIRFHTAKSLSKRCTLGTECCRGERRRVVGVGHDRTKNADISQGFSFAACLDAPRGKKSGEVEEARCGGTPRTP